MKSSVFLKVKVAALWVIFSYFLPAFAQHEHWTFNQQENWPGDCNVGRFQSPINIQENMVTSKNGTPELKFQNLDKSIPTTVTNNGHTVRVTIPGKVIPIVSGGGLNGTYIFENLHFHWPAEHYIDGNSFDLEAHLVFYSSRFPNITVAMEDKNGIAILGILYNRVLTRGAAIFETLASATQRISKRVDSETQTTPIDFQDLMPNNLGGFYYYRGSLTTPNCNEDVSWYILKGIGKINSNQYKSLTTIYGSNNQQLTFTNRKIQPLNGRAIYFKPY